MQKLSTFQIFLRFALVGILIVLISFVLSYFQLERTIEKNFIDESNLHLAKNFKILDERVKSYEQILLTLSRSLFIHELETSSKPLAHLYLKDIFSNYNELLQLRVIDNNGDERFRIYRTKPNETPTIVPKTNLQNKKHRYYFDAIMKQPDQTIWYSEIDLNMEYGQIERPFVPTLRMGTPLYINGKREGFLLFNISMSTLFESLQEFSYYLLSVVDPLGNYLIHPDHSHNWSKFLDLNYTLYNDFGHEAEKILTTNTYTTTDFFTKTYTFSNEVRYIFIAKPNLQMLETRKMELMKLFALIALLVLIITIPFSYFISVHIETLYARLVAIINSLGHGVFILDKNNTIDYINNNALNILGYEKQSLLRTNFHTKIKHAHEDGTPLLEAECPIINIQNSRDAFSSESHTFTTKEGKILNINFTTTPLIIRGKFKGSITAFHDISQRKALERELMDATQKLRLERNLFLVGPVIVFSWKNIANWPVEYVSANVTKLFGYAKHEFTSGAIHYSDCIHPADLERVTQDVENALEKQLKHFNHKPYRIIDKDGVVHWIDDRATLIRNDDEQVTHFHSYILDITQEKLLEDQLNLSEEKYRKLVENSSAGVFKCSKTFEFSYVNQAILSIFGFEKSAQFYEHTVEKFFLNTNDAKALLVKLMKEESVKNYRLQLITPKKVIKTILLNAQLEGETISGMLIDISEIAKAQEEIRKLSTVLEQIDDLVTITDINGRIIYTNEAMSKFSGYSKKEIIGSTPKLYKSSKHTSEDMKKLWQTILAKKVYRGVVINKKKDGSLFYEEKTITPLLDDKGDITSFVSTGKDISERIRLQHELEKLATTDHLTKLYNRLKFEELFENELNNVKRYNRHLSLIMLDIDFFKKINDTYGHEVGDSVLVELSTLLKKEIRSTDKVARWGGEEFMILVPETDVSATLSLAEKLREKIEHFTFSHVGKVTSSFGVTQLKEDEDFHAITHRVDVALYQAKTEGRNRVIAL